jgi:hypothetical protein
MYNILKQLQEDSKEITILLSTNEWLKGTIVYLDAEYMSYEALKKDGVFYSLIVRLSAILAVEFVSGPIGITKEEIEALSSSKSGSEFIEGIDDEDDFDQDYM